jgi:hypothetical protein
MIDPVQSAVVETGEMCASASLMMSSVPQWPGRRLSCGAYPLCGRAGSQVDQGPDVAIEVLVVTVNVLVSCMGILR